MILFFLCDACVFLCDACVFLCVILVVGCALRIPKHKYYKEKHKKHMHHNNTRMFACFTVFPYRMFSPPWFFERPFFLTGKKVTFLITKEIQKIVFERSTVSLEAPSRDLITSKREVLETGACSLPEFRPAFPNFGWLYRMKPLEEATMATKSI